MGAPRLGMVRNFTCLLVCVSASLIASGPKHSCGLLQSTGSLECWGSNSYGELNSPLGAFSTVVSGGDPNGGFFSCAISSTGELACWGENSDGQATPPSGTFVGVATGQKHACAVASDSSIKCWGKNTNGVTDPPSGVAFTHVATGLTHACGLTAAKSIVCW